jgi:cytochrome c oxidase subunit 4
MARTKLYTVMFGALFAMATAQVVVEEYALFSYWTGFAVIVGLSFVKAAMVAGYYQHLRWEPRSVTVVMLIGLAAALALTVAAAYSIL